MINSMTVMHRRVTWRTWTALAGVALVAALDWWWVWGVWMCYYAAVGIRSGKAFLVEPVTRADNPIAFWIVTAMWTASGVWIVAADLNRGPWWTW